VLSYTEENKELQKRHLDGEVDMKVFPPKVKYMRGCYLCTINLNDVAFVLIFVCRLVVVLQSC
jgi:hypothetical protein